MSPLYFQNSKFLMNNNNLAVGPACCCSSSSSSVVGGRIVFTGNNSSFTVPSTGTTSSTINSSTQLSTTGGTTIFAGANGWLNANNIAGVQSFAWQVVGPGGTDRQVNLRFNRFKLVGSCAVCGQLIIPSSDALGQGGLYPATGLALNCGTSQSVIRAGLIYGLPAITANTSYGIVNIGVEANSGGLYTITIDCCG